jgi:hypothetical protein
VAKFAKELNDVALILYTIHDKIYKFDLIFLSEGFLSIIVYIEIKIVRFSTKTNRQTKGLENHQEGFQSCPLCINGITVDKKAASHIITLHFHEIFHWLSFGRLKLISRVVFLWFVQT